MSRYYEDEEGYEIDNKMDFWDNVDYQYDQMRDSFLMIQNEDDAKRCIKDYPRSADKYLPTEYRYLLGEKK